MLFECLLANIYLHLVLIKNIILFEKKIKNTKYFICIDINMIKNFLNSRLNNILQYLVLFKKQI